MGFLFFQYSRVNTENQEEEKKKKKIARRSKTVLAKGQTFWQEVEQDGLRGPFFLTLNKFV